MAHKKFRVPAEAIRQHDVMANAVFVEILFEAVEPEDLLELQCELTPAEVECLWGIWRKCHAAVTGKSS